MTLYFFPFVRYLLFNFPPLSALVGVSSNFIFLSLLFVLSYVRLLLKEEWSPEQVRLELLQWSVFSCRAAHFMRVNHYEITLRCYSSDSARSECLFSLFTAQNEWTAVRQGKEHEQQPARGWKRCCCRYKNTGTENFNVIQVICINLGTLGTD